VTTAECTDTIGKRSNDPVSASRGERETTTNRTHMTCQPGQVTRPTYIQHSGEDGENDPIPEGKNNKNKVQRPPDIAKGTHRQDPIERRNGNGGTYCVDHRPQTTASPQSIVDRAPMQHDGGTTPIPQTQHILHRTPQDNKKAHREHQSPRRTPEKTYKLTSRNPPQHSRQRPHAQKDPLAATHGELYSTAPRAHKTSRAPHGNIPAHRSHTGESGNTHHEDKNPEHKAHRRQNEGKETTGEYP
jgi:hypothetical protein